VNFTEDAMRNFVVAAAMIAGLAAKLRHEFVNLRGTRRADRMSLRFETARWIDR
jgi:hypothetical protein